jgi:hypothetical protein
MTAPVVIPITFAGDALASSIDAFVAALGAEGAYWAGATHEYGVGALTSGTPQHLAETPQATLADADVQAWLSSKITSGAGFPQPNANTVYAIFYPATTTVTRGTGSLCSDFDGYHADFVLASGAHASYAVMGRCTPSVAGMSMLDNLTAATSHEIVEVATDPRPSDDPAWSEVDAAHEGWTLVGGGPEIGDLCAPFPGVFYVPALMSNVVQRVWSNAAAAASHDPCQPAGATPYFNAAPELADDVMVSSPSLGVFSTKGVRIPVGGQRTIPLHLYSDGPTGGPWKVSVIDAGTFFGLLATLSFTLDKTEGQNGDTIQLTIQALSASSLGASPFWIQSDLGGASTVWLGVVGN